MSGPPRRPIAEDAPSGGYINQALQGAARHAANIRASSGPSDAELRESQTLFVEREAREWAKAQLKELHKRRFAWVASSLLKINAEAERIYGAPATEFDQKIRDGIATVAAKAAEAAATRLSSGPNTSPAVGRYKQL
tara:strand:- start:122 stop:532 length:411 start_codon:yes stop_codon:yes gene_type:complete